MAVAVEGIATTTSNSATSAHTVSLPASIAAGELLLMLAVVDFTVSDFDDPYDVATASGWTVVHVATRGYFSLNVLKRTATGSEGSTVTVNTAVDGIPSNTIMGAAVFRISGASGNVEVASVNDGFDDTADPPSLTPSWGEAENLWFAGFACRQVEDVVTWPTGYTGGQVFISEDGSGGSNNEYGLGWSYKVATATSDNPSTITCTDSGNHRPFTIAVEPGAGGAIGVGTSVSPFPGMAGSASEVIAATGTSRSPFPRQAGSASMRPAGSGAQASPHPTMAGSASQVVAGSGAQAAPHPTMVGAATETIAATGAQQAPHPSQAGIATAVVAGSGAQTAPFPGQQGSAAQATTATGGSVSSFPTQAGAALELLAASGVQVLPFPAMAGLASMLPSGVGAQVAPFPTMAGQGTSDSGHIALANARRVPAGAPWRRTVAAGAPRQVPPGSPTRRVK